MSQYSGLSATFKAAVKLKGNKPRIGIALSGIAKYYSRGKAFSMDSKSYTDELSSAPSLSLSSKITGGLSTVNKLNINILNQNLVSDTFSESGLYPDPENTAVKAYLVFDTGTTGIADAVQFFNGMIDDFPSIDYKSLKIECASIDKRLFRTVGDFVTDSDAPSGYVVPEASLGRMKPEIYGDHRVAWNHTADNNQAASGYQYDRENNLVEAIPLGGGQFLIANHEVDAISGDADSIWMFDESIGKMVEVASFSVTQNTSAGCIITITPITSVISNDDGDTSGSNGNFDSAKGGFTAAVTVGDFLIIEDGDDAGEYQVTGKTSDTRVVVYGGGWISDTGANFHIESRPEFYDWRLPIGADNISGWSNLDRVYDRSVATAATAAALTGDTTGNADSMTIKFDPFSRSLEEMIVSDSKLYLRCAYTEGGNADLDLWVGGNTTYTMSANDNATEYVPTLSGLPRQAVTNCKVHYGKISTGAETGTCSIYEAIQKIAYKPGISTDNMRVFFGGTGRPYGSWMNGRTNHQEAENALIENAAGCVESVLRDILPLTSTNIDMDDFDTASTDLSTTKFSFSLTEPTKSAELIHDMLERVKSVGHFNYDDKFRMVVYDADAGFAESGDGTPNDDDKFLFTTTESGDYADNTRQIDEHPIIKDSFWVRKNPATQIVTKFELDYYKMQSGGYAKQLTATDNTYHAEDITKRFSHPFTKDTTTAQLWLTFLQDRLNRKHWTCGFDTFYNAIGKEMWDNVNVQHPVLTNLISGVTTKKWRILKLGIATDLGKISIEVEEQ